MSRYKNNGVKWKNEGESGFFFKKNSRTLASSKIVCTFALF